MIDQTVLQCTHQQINSFRPGQCPTAPLAIFVKAASVVTHQPLQFRLFNLKTGRFNRKINLMGKRAVQKGEHQGLKASVVAQGLPDAAAE